MMTSDRGVDLITEWEGLCTRMYLDSGGLPTIGVGHLLTKSELTSGKVRCGLDLVPWREGLTREQCKTLLRNDLALAEDAVETYVTHPLEQRQYDALVSFAFNVGAGAFAGSTLVKRLNADHPEDVPAQLRRWVHCAGKVVQGLVNRREKEIALWEGRL